jgi:hypothetical protein
MPAAAGGVWTATWWWRQHTKIWDLPVSIRSFGTVTLRDANVNKTPGLVSWLRHQKCRENPDINFKTWNSETAVYSVTFWFHENLATADTLDLKDKSKRGVGGKHGARNNPRGLTRTDLSGPKQLGLDLSLHEAKWTKQFNLCLRGRNFRQICLIIYNLIGVPFVHFAIANLNIRLDVGAQGHPDCNMPSKAKDHDSYSPNVPILAQIEHRAKITQPDL